MDDYMLIIDGSSLLSTQYYGNLPREVLMGKSQEEREANYYKIMHTASGVYTNGVYGFLRYLFKLMETMPPKYLAVAWDLTRDTFRRELYADYKGNRGETPFPLKEQFALCQSVLKQMGIRQYMDERYEADDFSGSLCRKFEKDIPIRILTKDHDYLQLVDDNVQVFLLQSAQSKADELLKKYDMNKSCCPEKCFLMNKETVLSEIGVKPSSVQHLKGLQGDTSDNIKGVPGIGEKIAVTLISKYETIDSLYEEIHSLGEASEELANRFKDLGLRKNVITALTKKDTEAVTGEEAARLSLTLATIKTDIPITEELSDLVLKLNGDGVEKVLHELEFNSLKAPKAFTAERTAMELRYNVEEIVDFDEAEVLFGRLLKSRGLSYGFSYDKDNETVFLAGIETVYRIGYDGLFLNESFISDFCERLLEHNNIYAFQLKEMTDIFTECKSRLMDVAVGDYLLRPLTGAHEAKDVAAEYMPDTVFREEHDYVAMLARAIGAVVRRKLTEQDMLTLYDNVEHPLIWVLADMERTGIYICLDKLMELDTIFSDKCREEEQVIYSLAGGPFNINSPKQLGEVLFDRLEIPGGKKTKSGYSTSADILEKLAEKYPIAQHVLTYRQYAKLQSVYAVGLRNCIAADGRIHTTFQQTVTATGRLSSVEPNLQNIPIRTELGRSIRKVFVPKDGCVFMDADYSQIELRLMAHMSGDKALIEAYNNSADIHRMTASQVFDIPFDEVTDAQRSAAKAVNFGIIYGISSFGLGQNLNISRKTAEQYIDSYYERYPSIRDFLENNVKSAGENGFVRTMYGRIRPIPELDSSNFMQRSFGERVAMNSPIQGTAADIMKLAMIRMHDALRAKRLKAKMLVQVHDEILLEVPEEEVEQVRDIVKNAMEGVADLAVPLIADIHQGYSWFEAK